MVLVAPIRLRLCTCLLKVFQSQAIWALFLSNRPVPLGLGITNNMLLCLEIQESKKLENVETNLLEFMNLHKL